MFLFRSILAVVCSLCWLGLASAQTFSYQQLDTELHYEDVNVAYEFHAHVNNLLPNVRSIRYTLTPVQFADTARQTSICTFLGCYPPRSGPITVDQEYEAMQQDTLVKFTVYNQISDWSQGFPIPLEAPLLGDYIFDLDVASVDDPNEHTTYRLSLIFGQGVARETITPFTSSLLSNYPNPFNAGTQLQFEVKQTGITSLTVFDLMGRLVAEPLIPTTLSAGNYVMNWNAQSRAGVDLPSGRYLIRMNSGSEFVTHPVTLIR